MKSYTLGLAGNGSYSNRGCEAIVRGTVALMRDHLGEGYFISNYFPSEGCRDWELEIDPRILHRPFPLVKRFSLPWIEEQIARKVFHQPHNIARVTQVFKKTLRETDAVMMLGGDNYSLDYPDSDVHFRLSRLAVETREPVIIWGASIGPFTNKPDYELWAANELQRVDLICARETATLEYLTSIGVTKNVVLTADPAFHLKPAPCELPCDIEKILQNGCVGVNLSPLLYRFVKISGAEANLANWANVAAEIIRSLLSRLSLPVLLVPHVISEVGDAGRDDYLFLKRVAQLLNEPEGVFTLGPNFNASQTKWILSRVRAFAGARTHSTIAAISSCVPTICIGYSMKARGIAQDVYGTLDWLISGQDLVKDPSVLRDRFITLLSQQAQIQLQLEQINPELGQRAQSGTKRVGDLLSNYQLNAG